MAQKAVEQRDVSVRLACRMFNVSESCYRYQAKLRAEDDVIADWLVRLTTAHRSWGFGLCFLYLRNVKGFKWNHKRVYRVYRELELNLRIQATQTPCQAGARAAGGAFRAQPVLVHGLYARPAGRRPQHPHLQRHR